MRRTEVNSIETSLPREGHKTDSGTGPWLFSGDSAFKALTRLFALSILAILLAMVSGMLLESRPSM